ncbi:Bacterial protein of uncharacterised function (DUF883) [Cedecea neteri]|uniref:Bacterial protein of uncharacterized function (DUF883) n=1 Tax=Cedecea neteri TaxID=158822 RepID=A0A2X3J511_9ENTR|nr:Bacterial protein of uncharacterised function (DUF883) [Cedecea neteri]
MQPYESRLDDDLALLSDTLEEVLRASGDPADQKYIELKEKAEQALNDVKARISNASDTYYYRTKKRYTAPMITCTKSPWQGIGIGAAVGLVIGLLLRR